MDMGRYQYITQYHFLEYWNSSKSPGTNPRTYLSNLVFRF